VVGGKVIPPDDASGISFKFDRDGELEVISKKKKIGLGWVTCQGGIEKRSKTEMKWKWLL
jgi:hypothetical protein